jgi:hypothetical protein
MLLRLTHPFVPVVRIVSRVCIVRILRASGDSRRPRKSRAPVLTVEN